jgi:hypothetical protein
VRFSRVLVAVAAVAAVAAAAACVPPAMIEPDARARLAFEPADGATGRQGQGLAVVIDDPGHILDAAALAALGGHVWLKTWPESTPVAITTEAIPGLFEFQKIIKVAPNDALEDRWYVLGVDELPPRVIPAAALPDGAVAARFRPGTHPRVAKLTLCGVTDDAMSLVVSFSEPVTTAGAPVDAVSLAVGKHPARCTWAGGDGGAYGFTCADVPIAASVTVSIGQGIAGVSGVALDPASWDVALPELPLGTCFTYAPAI